MQKLDLQTFDSLSNNIELLQKLFPQVITEKEDSNWNIIKAIDFDLFKALFSKELVEDNDERYNLNWPGKKASILKANTPINKTLRPVKEESINFDTTENLYIEWDNFEVLKVLQESYLWKVKMIYIDPPYNTWKDFVYKDNFKVSKEDYEEELGTIDEEWWKLFRNTDTNGRFHSDWLSMMYERLVVARDLLKDDWVIFMSIDDNEVHNLRKIADEIFGEENFVANVIWERAFAPVNLKYHFSESHDYILCFAKDKQKLWKLMLSRSEEANDRYQNLDNDPRWVWTSWDFSVWPAVENNIYEIINPAWISLLPPNWRSWRVSKEKFNELLNDNRVWFWETWKNVPRLKRFLSDVKDWITPMTLWKHIDVWHSQEATKQLKLLFEDKHFFDYSKPVWLIKRCIDILNTNQNDIILDFFSWSATTAHTVMQLNAEDGWNRKFIMVQIPELTDENSEAYKAWYRNICEIWKERIRRAGKKILEDNKDKLAERETPLDTWFRVYKIDSSNMKDVYFHPSVIDQSKLFDLESNIKEDRSPLDLLTGVMIDLWLTLDLPIEEKTIAWNTVYFVAWNSLVACFDEFVDFAIVDEIASLEPLKVVFRDASFRTDSDKINFETRFKKLSPESVIRVI